MSIIFRKQLASIMEVLTSAAVTEISKLVDDGYAVLRLEMSRYVKENDALRKRLRMMELRVSRPCPERADAMETSANRRSFDVQVCQEPRVTKESLQALGKRLSSHLHAGGQTSPAPDDNAPEQPATSSHKLLQCADMEEGSSESVIIKKEELEEERHPLGEINAGDERAVEWRSGSREKRPVQEMQNKAANHTEELTEQHRTRRAVWEVSGLESVLKAEGESECVETLQHRATEHRAEALNSLDSEFVMFERPGPLGSYCTPGGAVTETEDPCCSYSAETGPPSLSFHSELQAVAGAGTGSGVTDNTSLSASYAETHSRKKLLICTFCGKAFNRPTKLEIHQRIHTGEKPFSCSLCGKRFAQSCNLNRHKIVHTGEKPFGCSQCGKRFARSCHLKMHQRVHASGRPYSYNRLSERRYLRIQPHRKQTGM